MNGSLRELMARAIADGWHDPIARWNAAAHLPPHRRPPWDGEMHIWLPIADAALAAIEASGTHVVVPVEPTKEMYSAGGKSEPFMPMDGRSWTPGQIVAATVWRAMLAARDAAHPRNREPRPPDSRGASGSVLS